MKILKKNIQTIDEFFEQKSDGVYYIGHASIIAKINNQNFLFDYVRNNLPYGDSWRFFPALTENIPMDRIDGIFISHVHQDHFDPIFLKSEDVKCPIYIIGGRTSFENILNVNDINYFKIQEGVKTEIKAGVYVYGFLNHSNGVDASCCIGNSNFSVYHGNDNYLNNENLQKIDVEFSSIDVACIPYAYINWYPQLINNLSEDEKAIESERLCNFYYEYAIQQADILNATQVIPFGANLCYKDSSRSSLNLECKTPIEFELYVKKTRGIEESNRFKALFANDSIVKINNELIIFSEDKYTEATYRDEMEIYLSSFKNPPVKKCNVFDVHEFSKIPTIKITSPTAYDHYLCVRNVDKNIGVMINTKNSVVSQMDLEYIKSKNIQYHIFNIENIDSYLKWVNGKLTVEEIIGTREFTVERQPNTYNKEVLFIVNTQI